MIRKIFQQQKAMLRATARGLNTASLFNSPTMGVFNGLQSYAMDDKTGKSYKLTPTTVSVKLVPVNNKAPLSPAVTEPTTCPGDQLTEAPATEKITLGGVIKIAGAVGSAFGPTISKKCSNKSSKTKESFGRNSYKKKTLLPKLR